MHVKFVRVPVIRTDEDNDFAARRLATMLRSLLTPAPGILGKDVDEIRTIAILTHHHVSLKMPKDRFSDPISAIRFRMKQLGLAPIDLVPYLGPIALVNKILNRQQDLTLEQIRKLRKYLDIPADHLIQPVRHWTKKSGQ
jgi:HTH-type transcriptional regulator/antitoxin HigA